MSIKKKWYKSKTINFNGLLLAVVAVLKALDVNIPAEAVAAIQTLMNIVLRFVTAVPLERGSKT